MNLPNTEIHANETSKGAKGSEVSHCLSFSAIKKCQEPQRTTGGPFHSRVLEANGCRFVYMNIHLKTLTVHYNKNKIIQYQI